MGKEVSRYTRSPSPLVLVLTLLTMLSGMRVPFSTTKVLCSGSLAGAESWAGEAAATATNANNPRTSIDKGSSCDFTLLIVRRKPFDQVTGLILHCPAGSYFRENRSESPGPAEHPPEPAG